MLFLYVLYENIIRGLDATIVMPSAPYYFWPHLVVIFLSRFYTCSGAHFARKSRRQTRINDLYMLTGIMRDLHGWEGGGRRIV